MLGKFARSHSATKELFDLSGKKLKFPATTRWLSIFIVYERVIEVFDHLNEVARKRETQKETWPRLWDEHKEKMENVVKLLRPLKEFCDRLQSANVTISLVYPCLQTLLKNYSVC